MNDRPRQLLTHFAELRRRFYISVGALVVATIAAFIFYQPIQEFVQQPAVDSLERLRPDEPARLVQLDITEGWSVTAKVSVVVGFAVSFPVTLYHILMFLRPGLKRGERRTMYMLLFAGTALFVAGAAFAYYIAVPRAIDFLLEFGGEIAVLAPRLSSYVSLVLTLTIWMGLIFELPVMMFLLARIGALHPERVSKFRRWVILFAFVLAAIVTPTVDPMTQVLIAVPAVVLFEVGLVMMKLAVRSRGRTATADADAPG